MGTGRSVRAAAVVAALFMAPAALAQSQWSRTYGGAGGGEFVHAVGELPGGDIVIAASTDSFGTSTGDAWLIRLDAAGNVLSEALAGNALPGGVDGAVVLPDGGAVFASRNVRDLFLIHDASIVRLNADGTIAWVTDVASSPSGRFFVNDLVANPDGSIVGFGQASLDDSGPFVGWVFQLDAAGALVWQQYHGGVIDTGFSFDAGIRTADGGYAVTGWGTSATGGQDLFVAKLTATGAITWSQQIGGADTDYGSAITEIRGGGGYAVAGMTSSFTASGRAGWVVRLDAGGAVTWTEAIGDMDWGDLEGIVQASDQDLVVLGRYSFATNDLWAAKIGQGTATIQWQRRYEGVSGDYAAEVAELSNGDLLMTGTWGWGFPEEDLWTLRTDANGQIPGCSLVQDTSLTSSAPRYARSTAFLPPYPPIGSARAGSQVTSSSTLTVATQCAPAGCPALSCDDIAVFPPTVCEGENQTLTLLTSGGTFPVDVSWDLDGDTLAETMGNPASLAFPAGLTPVTAFASDACSPTPQTCSLRLDVTVMPRVTPGEVSDVRAGAVPLLVLEHGGRVTFEERVDAVDYNLYVGDIGAWYTPGVTCSVPTTPAGAGVLEIAPVLLVNTWQLVSASSDCRVEGTVGRDSFGVNRRDFGIWPTCP